MKTIVLAYHNVGCAGIKALVENGFDITAVFTHKDNAKENIWFNSVAEYAARLNIPVFVPEDINHPLWVQRIREMAPDIIFSFYYRNMVGSPILEIPLKGCLNFHGSFLPEYRGRCPVNWAIVNGEKETGATLHYMTPRPDDGDIVCQEKIKIADNDTSESLHGKMVKTASNMLNKILPLIKEDRAPSVPQDHSRATYFGGRSPDDGEIDWSKSASEIKNLIRAVSKPYPGAFSFAGDRKCLFWSVKQIRIKAAVPMPGTVISTDPFVIAAGRGALQVDLCQPDDGVYMSGVQLARELGIYAGMRFGHDIKKYLEAERKKKVLILGIDGFIGNALSERLLASGKYEVHGMDLRSGSIERFLKNPDFHFYEGDISIHREWIKYHVKKCDIIIPLVAIATPIEYTRNPLRVFELDFEENLKIVRYCVQYGKRILFPSTSEVYGMCEEDEFDEDNSRLVLGPVRKQRWIYSCCKQLIDRVIWAYGQSKGLKFTLFRPFNWVGPRLDTLNSARIGSSRVITQLILNLVEGSPIKLVDGGNQKRCFTDVADGVECLYRIIENKGGLCDGQIINIGNPENDLSIKELANMLVEKFSRHSLSSNFPVFAGFREVESKTYYGPGYEDIKHRKPSIRNAGRLLDWFPKTGLEQSIEQTLDFFLHEAVESGEFNDVMCNPENFGRHGVDEGKVISLSLIAN